MNLLDCGYKARFATFEGRKSDFEKILNKIGSEIAKHNKLNQGNLFQFELHNNSYVFIRATKLQSIGNYAAMSACGLINFTTYQLPKEKIKVRINPKFNLACKIYGREKIMNLAASPNPDSNKICFELIKHVDQC
jgi:hypothetical protein